MTKEEYKVEDLIKSYKDTFDKDCEWAGAAHDHFCHCKSSLIEELESITKIKELLKAEFIKTPMGNAITINVAYPEESEEYKIIKEWLNE